MRIASPYTPPNNGMHPTPHHVASHESWVGALVMPGVRRLPEASESIW